MMGGAKKIMKKGKKLFERESIWKRKRYSTSSCMRNRKIQAAKNMLADVWEQIGYQTEGAGMRNIYLTGAKELRDGIVPVSAVRPAALILYERPQRKCSLTTSAYRSIVAKPKACSSKSIW